MMIEFDEPGADRLADTLGDELARFKQEHRDLDAAIATLSNSGSIDILQLQRLKKRKLLLKDRIMHLQDQITPDIIA